MQIADTIFHILTLLVLLAMAARYGLARQIHDYHEAIIADGAVTGNAGLKLVLGACYHGIGAGALAVAIAYAVLVFRIEPATGYGEGYAFLTVCALALPALASTYRVERASKVRTPWRVIAAGLALATIAYAL
jgi:hypothetical protein